MDPEGPRHEKSFSAFLPCSNYVLRYPTAEVYKVSKYSELKSFNLNTFKKMKADGEKITCITAYDYTSAKIVDNAGIEMILTGDSLGNVMNGYANSIPVTMEEMIYHSKAVKRAVSRAYLIIDMPFGSFQISEEETLRNAHKACKRNRV